MIKKTFYFVLEYNPHTMLQYEYVSDEVYGPAKLLHSRFHYSHLNRVPQYTWTPYIHFKYSESICNNI